MPFPFGYLKEFFYQARSIQELAKKNFDNLRQDSDDNKPEPKIVRRGRPPTKHLKLQAGPSLERASSEFSDATLATGGENTTFSNYNLRKAPSLSDKFDPFDLSGRSLNGSRNSETYASLLAEQKFGKSEEFIGLKLCEMVSLTHHMFWEMLLVV